MDWGGGVDEAGATMGIAELRMGLGGRAPPNEGGCWCW